MKFTSFLPAVCVLGLSNASPLFGRQSLPKEQISQEFLDELVFYGRYAPTYPKAPCMVPPNDTVVQGFANTRPRTEMTLFRSDVDRELVMAFPGTSGLVDFLTDIIAIMVPYKPPGVECPGCRAHFAVLNAWNKMQPSAQAVLDEALAEFPDYDFVIVGHSLGGALTQFAYNFFSSQGYNVRAAYSYGQFRVGNKAFVDFVDGLSGATDDDIGNYYRVTHANDGVPKAISDRKGFRHPRTEIWFAGPGNGTASVETTFRCFGQEPADCNNSEPPDGLIFGINEAHISYPGINVVGCGGFPSIGTELPF